MALCKLCGLITYRARSPSAVIRRTSVRYDLHMLIALEARVSSVLDCAAQNLPKSHPASAIVGVLQPRFPVVRRLQLLRQDVTSRLER